MISSQFAGKGSICTLFPFILFIVDSIFHQSAALFPHILRKKAARFLAGRLFSHELFKDVL